MQTTESPEQPVHPYNPIRVFTVHLESHFKWYIILQRICKGGVLDDYVLKFSIKTCHGYSLEGPH